MFDGRKIDPIFSGGFTNFVQNWSLSGTISAVGKFTRSACPVSPRWSSQVNHLQVTKSATGFNPKVTTLHNFGEKFKAICLVLSNIVYFCHSGSILVSSCLVPQMDTKLKHIPAFRSPLQNVIELFKEDWDVILEFLLKCARGLSVCIHFFLVCNTKVFINRNLKTKTQSQKHFHRLTIFLGGDNGVGQYS